MNASYTRVIATFLLSCLLVLGVSAQTSETPTGAGTFAEPYRITKLNHLVWMKNQALSDTTAGKYYKLMNNIDASATSTWGDNPYSTTDKEGFIPIGQASRTAFKGTFEGNNKVISGLYVRRDGSSDYQAVGLFGMTNGATISNLTMTGAKIQGDVYVGSIVGYAASSTIISCNSYEATISGVGTSTYAGALVGAAKEGSITACKAGGTVSTTGIAPQAAGMLAGGSDCKISECITSGTITGKDVCGGLVGHNANSITASGSTVNVTSSDAGTSITGGGSVGGLVGWNTGRVETSYAVGNVTGTTCNYVGGLVGWNNKSGVNQCYATATVNGVGNTGGLVGYSDNDAVVQYSYATGSVVGGGTTTLLGASASCGGLVGYNYRSTVRRSYSTTTVSGAAPNRGGLIGLNVVWPIGGVNDCYWDKVISGQSTSAGGNGRLPAEMRLAETFKGWDFLTTWNIEQTIGTPYLRALPYASLTADLLPDAAAQKAKWSLDKGMVWNASGEKRIGLPPGTYVLSFSELTGYDTPATQSLTLKVDEQTVTTATYKMQKGSLVVNINGPSAARWKISTFDKEYESGTTATIAVGNFPISFTDVPGYATPKVTTATITKNTIKELNVTYVKQKGAITVNINGPPSARWWIDNLESKEYFSGTTVEVTTGTHTVHCTTVRGWDTPPARTFTTQNTTTVLNVTYVNQTGAITVNLTGPQSARWWIDNLASEQYVSGTTVDVTTGTHTVHCTTVGGWDTPPARTFTATQGVTSTVDLSYTAREGIVIMTINGPANASWYLNDDTTTHTSGQSVDVPTGTHRIYFTDVNGWITPTAQNITVLRGETYNLSATYVAHTGTVTANITGPATAGWWIDDITSPTYAANVPVQSPVGTHTANFVPVYGWDTPTTQTYTIAFQEALTLNANYIRQYGTLTVKLVGAKDGRWSIDKGATWYVSETVIPAGVGDQTVIFRTQDGYKPVAAQIAKVLIDQKTSLVAYYEPAGAIDLDLKDGTFTATQLAPGNKMAFDWEVDTNATNNSPFWCEIFASKTGGFDLVRFGSTLTESFKHIGVTVGETTTISNSNLVLKTVPDGVYTLVPSVNRGSLLETQRIAETNYVNNWMPVAGKRLTVRIPRLSQVDLKLIDAVFTPEDGSTTQVTVTGTVQNVGTEDVPKPGFWVEAFYGRLTAEGSLDPEGTIGDGQLISSLDINATATFTLRHKGMLKAGLDKRAIAVIVDSTDIIPEIDETNNSDLWYEARVLPPGKANNIDLAIVGMSVQKSQLAPNQVIPEDRLRWTVSIENRGTTVPETPVYLELFGSQDGGVSVMRGATATWSDKIVVPDPGTSGTYTRNQNINNIGTGMYTLVAVVNRDGVSSNPGDETPLDNRYVYSPGRISLAQAESTDVNIVWLAGPDFTYVGGKMIVTGTIKNVGTATSRSFWTEAFAGTMEKRTGFFLRELPIAGGSFCNGLAPGATMDISITGAVDKNKVVGILADSTDIIPESDETDNYGYSDLTN